MHFHRDRQGNEGTLSREIITDVHTSLVIIIMENYDMYILTLQHIEQRAVQMYISYMVLILYEQ